MGDRGHFATQSSSAVFEASSTPLGRLKTTRPHPAFQTDDTRPTKRPRLTPPKDRSRGFPTGRSVSLGKQASLHKEVTGKDEKALLDDLMAGLDASVFDNFEVSPVKPTHRQSHSPVKVKVETDSGSYSANRRPSPAKRLGPRGSLSPSKQQTHVDRTPLRGIASSFLASSLDHTKTSPIRPPKAVTTKTVKREPLSRAEADVKVETGFSSDVKKVLSLPDHLVLEKDVKPKLFDEDLVDFDFDLSDLSAFEDDLLLKSEVVQVRMNAFVGQDLMIPSRYDTHSSIHLSRLLLRATDRLHGPGVQWMRCSKG